MRLIMLALSTLLVLAGCSTEPAESTAPSPSPSAVVTDVSSGRALSEFEDSPTYPYRKNLAEDGNEYLATITSLRPAWDHPRNFTDAISLCDDLARGLTEKSEAAQLDRTKIRFEGGTTPDVTDDEARALLGAVIEYACPELG